MISSHTTSQLRVSLFAAFALAVSLGLMACGSDLTSPTSPTEESLGKDQLSTGLNLSSQPAGPNQTAPSLGMRLLDRAGSPGEWCVARRDGVVVATFANLDDAVHAFYSNPRRRHSIAYTVDFRDKPGFQKFLDDMNAYHDQIWGDPHVQELVQRAESDITLLSGIERRWYSRVYLPLSEVRDDLAAVQAAMNVSGKLWGILKAFLQALAGEDNRFGDDDGDGIFNVSDDDYEGTLWSAGHITVTADGGDHDVHVNPCFDPCPIPAACEPF